MNKKVLILKTQDGDWEGIFINDELIEESSCLGEGEHLTYLTTMSKEHSFNPEEISFKTLNDIDNDSLQSSGNFPKNLKDLNGQY